MTGKNKSVLELMEQPNKLIELIDNFLIKDGNCDKEETMETFAELLTKVINKDFHIIPRDDYIKIRIEWKKPEKGI